MSTPRIMFGPILLNTLKNDGIDVSGVAEDPDHTSGVGMIILNAERQNHVLAIYGANLHSSRLSRRPWRERTCCSCRWKSPLPSRCPSRNITQVSLLTTSGPPRRWQELSWNAALERPS